MLNWYEGTYTIYGRMTANICTGCTDPKVLSMILGLVLPTCQFHIAATSKEISYGHLAGAS